jgi:Immunity protein 17
MSNALIALLVIAAGAFTLAGSLKNWDWFFNNRRARLIVAIFGRNGARIFYGLLGGLLIVGGLGFGILLLA